MPAFVQEQTLKAQQADAEAEWADYAAGLQDTLSKQARLISLRQVPCLNPNPGTLQSRSNPNRPLSPGWLAITYAVNARVQSRFAGQLAANQ